MTESSNKPEWPWWLSTACPPLDAKTGCPSLLVDTLPREEAPPGQVDAFEDSTPVALTSWSVVCHCWISHLPSSSQLSSESVDAMSCRLERGRLPAAPPLPPAPAVVRLEGEYWHIRPTVRQREHMGRALEHLTLARKQPSQDARSRGLEGSVVLIVGVQVSDGGGGHRVLVRDFDL